MQNLDKNVVKKMYGDIANLTVHPGQDHACCVPSEIDTVEFSVMAEKYEGIDGYAPEADFGLGCGIPTQYANIRKGESVLDLGSGAGNDCFIASKLVGDTGKVIGIDMTEDMVRRANENKAKLNINNVDFVYGEIEDMPIEDAIVDVVISNCVLNLVPDKNKAFAELYRVLKSGGRFTVSDIVLTAELPENIRKAAVMYAGCVSGAIHVDEYLGIIAQNGFKDVKIVKEKDIHLPDGLLKKYLSDEEIIKFRENGAVLKSVTVYAEK